VLVRCPGACQLQRVADRRAGGFRYPDVGAGEAVGRSVAGGERALVGQELDDRARVVDQGEAVRCSVLDTVRGIGYVDHSEPATDVRDRGGQGSGVVHNAGAAVVEHDAPAAEGGAGRAGNLDRLADVRARVVVVDFIDEDCRLRDRRDGCGENDKSDCGDSHTNHQVPPLYVRFVGRDPDAIFRSRDYTPSKTTYGW
jgi:hypothetical protein